MLGLDRVLAHRFEQSGPDFLTLWEDALELVDTARLKIGELLFGERARRLENHLTCLVIYDIRNRVAPLGLSSADRYPLDSGFTQRFDVLAA